VGRIKALPRALKSRPRERFLRSALAVFARVSHIDCKGSLSLQPCRLAQNVRLIRSLPGEVLVVAPEVSVSRRLLVDRLAQVQIPDNGAGAQVEVLADQLGDLLVIDLPRAERLHVDRERMRHPDRVCHLDLAAVSQSGCHHVLRHPAAGVRRRAVHLRGVLAAECAAAVPAHPAVRVHDDLASGHTRVAHRTADHEPPGGVHIDLGLVVHQFRRDDRVDDMFNDRFGDVSVRNIRGVLRADQNGVHPHGFAVRVFHRHLALAVWSQPGQRASLAHFRQPPGELVCQVDRHRHLHGGLVAGVPEHHPLVAGADLVEFLFGHLAAFFLEGMVHTQRDILGLAGDGGHHRAGVTVETCAAVVVPDVDHHLTHQLVKVDEGVGGDLAEHHHEAGFGRGFACHPGAGVLRQAGVEHRVAHLVAQFVRVTLGHRLGGEFVAG
jgi:hypothetical protein